MSNRPAIPEPYTNLHSLKQAVDALKEAVELLQGQRGVSDDAAVSWGDLVKLGLIDKTQVPVRVGTDFVR